MSMWVLFVIGAVVPCRTVLSCLTVLLHVVLVWAGWLLMPIVPVTSYIELDIRLIIVTLAVKVSAILGRLALLGVLVCSPGL